MPATFGRITRKYEDISGCFRALSLIASHIVVYEHEADAEINRTHCHFLIQHACDTKTIKNNIQKALLEGDRLNGNQDWSVKNIIGESFESFCEQCSKCITYMSKGQLEALYNQGYTKEELKRCSDLWVEKLPAEAPSKVNKLFKTYKEILSSYYKSHISKFEEIPNRVEDIKLNLVLYPRFEKVKSFFWTTLRHDYSHLYPMVSPQFFKDRKTMVLTYCYNNEVSMPPGKDLWDSE